MKKKKLKHIQSYLEEKTYKESLKRAAAYDSYASYLRRLVLRDILDSRIKYRYVDPVDVTFIPQQKVDDNVEITAAELEKILRAELNMEE